MRACCKSLLLLFVVLAANDSPAVGQPATAAPGAQIAAAVLPAPEAMRADATVLGYDAEGKLVSLRDGSGGLVCLADNPGDERFHVACYQKELEDFMARGRALRAEEKTRPEIMEMREQEIASGHLQMPEGPTALYSLTGSLENLDAEAMVLSQGTRVSVIYIPYATEASTGLPPKPAVPGAPWLMSAGKPWAHVMVVQPVVPEAEDGEDSADGEDGQDGQDDDNESEEESQ